jgi:beta-ribofuranosylaminobenzene 5'-phosphate synthase
MKIVPGIIKNDLECFGEGLKRIQSIGFKRIEISLQDPIVKGLLKFFDQYGVKAYGMSSFGPTVVGITESDEEAKKLSNEVKKRIKNIGGHLYVCRPNNTGATIEYLE